MSTVRHKQGKLLLLLTAERVAELQALTDAPDSTIDYSDIPRLVTHWTRRQFQARSTSLSRSMYPCGLTQTFWRS